ncbi:MAG: hypothetical protein TU35_003250 [Thermoproteus sp. AZ2]|uniref:Uncharacterized protein n=1 Tax=Thermoproteus sp. AZ2 TaxID=1609232 RepID=A0ACC6V092_9CREN|nr:MAG: hypothetical protein TU35_01920 [Thermoproteus sp. AZ2]
MFWRLFPSSKQKELPKVGGKPVYIGGVLFMGTAERGEFDVKRHKLVALYVRDGNGSSYRLDTSNVKVKISRDNIDLDISAMPRFFEVKMRELNSIMEQLKTERNEIESAYKRLEDALIRGVISLQTYEESRKRIAEKERRLQASCIEAEKSFLGVGDTLKRLAADVEARREALEAKKLLDKLEPGEEAALGNLISLRSTISSIEQMLNTMLLQLRLIC